MLNKEITDLVKEIAVLCIDKGINFSCSYNDDTESFAITAATFDGIEISYIGLNCLVVAEWKESSKQDLINLKNEVINHG